MNYGEFSYRLLHDISMKYAYLFKDIKEDLLESDIKYSVQEYFASMLMTIILSTPLLVVFTIGLFLLVRDLLISIIGGIIFYALVPAGIIALFYLYPSQQSENIKKKIENAIHFAVIYMETMAGTGAPPHLLFRILGSFEEFTEISKISRKISRDIEIFGMDPAEAITKAADKTPSPSMKELLWGMKATITSGGDLRLYLSEKAKAFTNDYRRKLEEFTQVLAVLLEVYITVVIVGSVLVLVLTTIMSLLSGGMAGLAELQLVVVTIGLPFMSVVFILLIKASSPSEV